MGYHSVFDIWSVLLLYYMRWLEYVDHFAFVLKIFMVVSLLLPLILNASVSASMGNEVFAWFFPFALLCQLAFSTALKREGERERESLK